ncbi:MAG: hypothetical protein FJ224_00270 [Lentisphaerae bacterium]|nr:hypothetical protein [Lentisphaerota bacterium]
MKTRKAIVVGLVFAVVAGMLIGAAVLLVRGTGELARAQTALDSKRREYDSYYGRKPFPSADNVSVEKRNLADEKGWLKNILAAAAEGTPEVQENTPSTFVRQLVEIKAQLKDAAARSRVALQPSPDAFSFSFQRYFEGSVLPDKDHVAMMSQQLAIVEGLCRLLFRCGVLSIDAVARDEFESVRATVQGPGEDRPGIRALAGASQRDGALVNRMGPVSDHQLYARMYFGLRFKSTEDTLWRVLNELAAHEVFCVVNSVSVEKDGQDIRSPRGLAGLAATDADVPAATVALREMSRQERQVTGKEIETPVVVTLHISAYLFKVP